MVPNGEPRRDSGCASTRADFGGGWLWLFPATYVLHAAEEVSAGEGYAAWVSGLSGQYISDAALVGIHAVLAVALTAAVLVIDRRRRFYWALTGIAGVFLGNGLLHLVMTLVTVTYSPGLLSGLLIWLPLAAYTWLRGWRRLPMTDLAWGGIIALLGTAVVSTLALNPGLIPLP